MAISMAFISCTLIFIIMITIVYFMKERISNLETKLYNGIIAFSIINLILELILCYNIYIDIELYSLYNLFINRSFLIALYGWFTLFTIYLFSISYQKKFKKICKIITIASIIIVILLLCLPIKLINENGIAYSTGMAVNLLYILCVIYSSIWIYVIFKKNKKIGKKKFYPFIALIMCFVLVLVVRAINPAILLNSFTVAFATALMFFTIENPDVKMVSALNQNRILIEKNNEEKSNLLFKISQEVKRPIAEIIKANAQIENSNDLETIKYNSQVINLNTKNLTSISDSLLDISKMDSKNIKIDTTEYNVSNLFNEIRVITKNKIKKDIEFRYNISKIVPEYLYGDEVKLKQVITSLLSNSIKYTTIGFIELDINAIIKYDICRLMITVSDSGKGIDIVKINEILSNDTNLTDEELNRLTSLDIDLLVINKVIKMLNGTMIIKSEVGQGSEFLIIIDQKIKKQESSIMKKVEKYSKEIYNHKKILVVDDDMEMLSKIGKLLEEKNYEVTKSSFGNNCTDMINNSLKFDLIILDDENIDMSAIDVLKMLKNNHINVPVIVILEKKKEFMKEHYLNDGFTDYIIKDNLKKELEKLDKYV
ncbi:MAG: response regulator [Bacilli bacterium]|nr:response regulator [Bacilli bacterium]